MRKQRIRIETGTYAPDAGGGIGWTTTATQTLWADVVLVSAEAQDRYQSVDKQIDYKFTFRGTPTISMKGTRFVWVSKGHPNKLKIYLPAAPPENTDQLGEETSVYVTDTGEVASA